MPIKGDSVKYMNTSNGIKYTDAISFSKSLKKQ